MYGALGGAVLATAAMHFAAYCVDFGLITLFVAVFCFAVAGACVACGAIGAVARGIRRIALGAARRPRLLTSVGLVLTVTAVIIAGMRHFQFGAHTPIRFRKTTEPQLAVFWTARGWQGVGGAPVFNENRRPMKLDGRNIVLDKKLLGRICSDHGLPTTAPSGERIVIKARVHLEPCSRPGSSLPLPDGRVHQETLSCYALVIDELLAVAWHGRRVE